MRASPGRSILNIDGELLSETKLETVMENLDAKMAEMYLDTKKIRRGFALVLVNDEFKHREKRIGAQQDKFNIMKFCERAKFTVNDIKNLKLKNTSGLKFDSRGLNTHNLTAEQMNDVFKTVSKGDFSSYDAFVCFISSHGSAGGIMGTDDELIPLQKIVDYFKATSKFPSLADKPKLFFTQNCRGRNWSVGVEKPDSDDDSDDVVADTGCVPVTIPEEADILIAYSSVDGYESYRNKKEGSWFVTELTKVFNKHAHNMDLTDMLIIVNNEVARKVSEKGKKQMPCFLTTLRKAVYFDLAQPSESPASSSQEPPNDQPAL